MFCVSPECVFWACILGMCSESSRSKFVSENVCSEMCVLKMRVLRWRVLRLCILSVCSQNVCSKCVYTREICSGINITVSQGVVYLTWGLYFKVRCPHYMTPESVLCSHVLRGVFYCFLRVCFQSFCLAVFVCGCVFSLFIKILNSCARKDWGEYILSKLNCWSPFDQQGPSYSKINKYQK